MFDEWALGYLTQLLMLSACSLSLPQDDEDETRPSSSPPRTPCLARREPERRGGAQRAARLRGWRHSSLPPETSTRPRRRDERLSAEASEESESDGE